jgi:hyaluronoglucosaminidase
MDGNGIFDGDTGNTPDHRYGASGIDGLSFGPAFGNTGGQQYLTLGYGVYSNLNRVDNDHQVLLQYDISGWSAYEQPLVQENPHTSGPAQVDGKYFVLTGNTRWGVQNLDYDDHLERWIIGVYDGPRKSGYPDFTMFAVDAATQPTYVTLQGLGGEQGHLIALAGDGLTHTPSGIRGWYQKADVGIESLGGGAFYLAADSKANGRSVATLTLAQSTEIFEDPLEPISVQAGDVRPVPQELADRDDGFPVTEVVGLVLPPNGDAGVGAAERVVRDVLEDADVDLIVTSTGADPHTLVTVWLGEADDVLAELGVESADDLGAEGYLLAAGRGDDGRGHIVIDGADVDGIFYGAHTVRQLVQKQTGHDSMPGVEVRDWPAMPYRGLIEGFYGTPWSHDDRLRLIDFLGDHKMNAFEYAPKDDEYHRDRWRDPYPANKLAELGQLIDRSRANRVNFTFALSPGLSICYTSEGDFQALIAKFEALYALGTRNFSIPLDDIDYNDWHCDADVNRFGTGGGAAGAAQAYILNRVQREWVEPKGDVAPLETVPTEYYNASETAYKRALREQMDADVVVQWTGLGVIPETITVEQAYQAREVFGHEIVVWDNYPVNDYIAGRLPLAPYDGRENGLSAPLAGIISNPMNQAAVSEIALASFGDFSWNDTAYDPRESWTAALLAAANGDADVAAALEAFADLSWYDGRLHHDQSPVLAGHIAEFWHAWEVGDTELAVQQLRTEIDRYVQADDVIRDDLNDDAFREQASADGTSWTTAASVRSGDGGVDTVYLDDATDTQFVRVQGVARATRWGYSLWELELYPVATSAP